MSAALALSFESDHLTGWLGRVEAMSSGASKLPGVWDREWLDYCRGLYANLRDHGAAILSAGFDVLDCVGVHREAGIVRVDACGALTISHRYVPVATVEPGLIRFANGLAYRGMTNRAASVPVWDVSRSKG